MKRKILLVDDEIDLRVVTSLGLKNAGYEVFEAADGRQALDLARSKMPDLIILDIFLPGVNGDEVAKTLKNDENLKRIPIILISAFSSALEERFGKCGAESSLAKPFAFAELVSTIKNHIG